MFRNFYTIELLVVILNSYLFLTLAVEPRAVAIAPAKNHQQLKNVKNDAVQAQAVEKLRKQVEPFLTQDYMKTDNYLQRWITDSKYNLNTAKDKLLKSLQWRKENNIDNVRTEDLSSIEHICTYTLDGHDKEFRPVITFAFGRCNLQRITISGNLPKLHRLMYRIFEDFEVAIHKLGKGKGDQGRIIMDLNGFNLRQHGCIRCLPYMLTLFQTYTEFYPGILKSAYFINVPSTAHVLIELLTPFFYDVLKDIVKVWGYDRSEWGPELLKEISPDQLPTNYGGTRKINNNNNRH